MHRLFLLLAALLFALPASGAQVIKKGGPNPLSGGFVAPGVVGSAGDNSTLSFIQGLDEVPFPQAIDPPRYGTATAWTDRFVSCESGGEWPLGNDSNTGTTPDEAYLTLGQAFGWMIGGEYRRINIDGGDTCDVAAGFGTGFTIATVNPVADIEDADLTTGSCPLWPLDFAALEQPCYWVRSGPGTGQAILDGTGLTVAHDFFSIRTESKGAHFLIENVDMICDTPDEHGNACIDTFDAGVATAVGVNMTIADNHNTSGQWFSCHDYSHIGVYGGDSYDFSGTPTASSTTALGTQDACSFVFHSSALVDTENGGTTGACAVANFTQGGSIGCSDDATLESKCETEPLAVFMTGQNMRMCDRTIAGTSVGVSFKPTTANSPDTISGIVRGHVADITLMNPVQDSSSHTHYDIAFEAHAVGDLDSGMDVEVTVLNSSFLNSNNDDTVFNFVLANGNAIGASDSYKINLHGLVLENDRGDSVIQQGVRFNDADFQDGTANSKLTIGDIVYEGVSTNFWMMAGSTLCQDADFTNWLDCVDDTTVLEVVGAEVDVTATSGTCETSATTTTTVCEDTSESWTTDELVGYVVELTSGSADNDVRRIASNTSDTFTLEVAASADMDAAGYIMEGYTDKNGKGTCRETPDGDGECLAAVTGNDSYYQFTVDPRLVCPSFICGNPVLTWDLSQDDIGRTEDPLRDRR